MTSSGTQAFELNTTQICNDALKLLQVTSFGQMANAADMEECLITLNMMFTSWRGRYKLMLQSEWITVTLNASSVVNVGGVDYECIRAHLSDPDNMPGSDKGASYWKVLATTAGIAWMWGFSYLALGNPSLDSNIIGVGRAFSRAHDSMQDTFIESKTVTADYFYLGNKTNVGKPIQAYFRRRDTNSLFLYPMPPDTHTYQINIEVYRRLDDMTDADNTPSFQAEWLQAITYNLAVLVHPKFETKTVAQLTKLERLAEDALLKAASLDEDTGDIVFLPRSGYGKRYY